jgi:hypothetical protein
MSNTFSESELRAAITGVFGDVPADGLRQRYTALCQGLSDKVDDSDEDHEFDREWVERMYPRLENWLYRLKALEDSYQQRVAIFLDLCRRTTPTVIELCDEFAQRRLERTWGEITQYFESVMPVDMLTCESAELSIDIESTTAWWTADAEDFGVELPLIAFQSLKRAGELSDVSAQQVVALFVKALCDGSAPLPGFQFKQAREDVTTWLWMSPERETQSVSPDADLALDELQIFYEQVPGAAAQLQFSGYSPLTKDAAGAVPELVAKVRTCGFSDHIVMREVGTPLAICVCRAIAHEDSIQFNRALGALSSLKTELNLHPV